MAEPTAAEIVAAFRAAGLDVYEMPGWAGRCRCHDGDHQKRVSPSGRGWETPKGVTIHHTAGPMLSGQKAIDYTRNILVGGNGHTPGPLCLAGVDADGRLLMVGAGRANHLGSISSKAATAIKNGSWPLTGYTDWRGQGVDGNSFTYGFEALAPMTPNDKQVAAMVTASAVLCRLLGRPATSVHGHGEASNQRSYEDPNLNMGAFRAKVAAAIKAQNIAVTKPGTTVPAPTTKPQEADMTLAELKKALKGDPELRSLVADAALSATTGKRTKKNTIGDLLIATFDQTEGLRASVDRLADQVAKHDEGVAK